MNISKNEVIQTKSVCLIFPVHFSCGAPWPSDRALASESRGPGFDPYRRPCVVSFCKAH